MSGTQTYCDGKFIIVSDLASSVYWWNKQAKLVMVKVDGVDDTYIVEKDTENYIERLSTMNVETDFELTLYNCSDLVKLDTQAIMLLQMIIN